MSWYLVDFRCKCGCVHGLSSAMQIPDGPTRAGTVAELYPSAASHADPLQTTEALAERAGGDLPPVLRRLLHDLVWCNEAEKYVEIADPERLVLTPRPQNNFNQAG